MPTPAEQLSRESDDSDYKMAIGSCIKHYMDKGMDQDQASAICYKQARESSGRDYPAQKKQVNRTTGLSGEGV